MKEKGAGAGGGYSGGEEKGWQTRRIRTPGKTTRASHRRKGSLARSQEA